MAYTRTTRRIGGGYRAGGKKPKVGNLVRMKGSMPTAKPDSLPIASYIIHLHGNRMK